MEFCIGDRVKVQYACDAEYLCGRTGTIVSITGGVNCAIDFGEHFMGHTCLGLCPTRTGW